MGGVIVSVTAFNFSGDTEGKTSAAVDFDGFVKIKVDELNTLQGHSVVLYEEMVSSGGYEVALDKEGHPLSVECPQNNGIFLLKGSYKVHRSSSSLLAGYVD